MEVNQKAQDQLIEDFFSNHNIELEKDEEVLHTLFSRDPYVTSGRFMRKVVMVMCLFVVIGWLVFGSVAALVLGVGGVVFGWIMDYNNHIGEKPSIFGLITSVGIRSQKNPKIAWAEVFHIRKVHNSGTYLVFDLIQKPEKTTWEELEFNLSHQTSDYIFVGGFYESHSLYHKVYSYWEHHDPMKIALKPVFNHLSGKYNCAGKERVGESISLLGQLNDFQISCFLDQRLPFKNFTASVKLPVARTHHLKIGEENTASTIKKIIGLNDIQIGDLRLDEQYQFLSSHETQLKELFTDDVIAKLKRMTELGTVNWKFGQPLQKKKLKRKSSLQDNEDVLDTGMLEIKEQTDYEIIDEKTYDILEFTGLLQKIKQHNAKVVLEFVTLGMELTLVLAEGINKAK